MYLHNSNYLSLCVPALNHTAQYHNLHGCCTYQNIFLSLQKDQYQYMYLINFLLCTCTCIKKYWAEWIILHETCVTQKNAVLTLW